MDNITIVCSATPCPGSCTCFLPRAKEPHSFILGPRVSSPIAFSVPHSHGPISNPGPCFAMHPVFTACLVHVYILWPQCGSRSRGPSSTQRHLGDAQEGKELAPCIQIPAEPRVLTLAKPSAAARSPRPS